MNKLSPTPKASSSFKAGFKDVSPLIFGIIPFGIIAGIVAVESGLNVFEAVSVSLIIFAGASQLAALSLYGEGVHVVVILLTITMINLRFMMYSASLGVYFKHLPMYWKTTIAYLLTDQAYALPIARFENPEPVSKRYYYLGVATTMWACWQLSTLAGAILGTGVPASWQLEFSIPLMFLALLLPVMKNHKHVLVALSSGIVAVAAVELPYNLGLVLAAVVGILAGVVLESRQA